MADFQIFAGKHHSLAQFFFSWEVFILWAEYLQTPHLSPNAEDSRSVPTTVPLSRSPPVCVSLATTARPSSRSCLTISGWSGTTCYGLRPHRYSWQPSHICTLKNTLTITHMYTHLSHTHTRQEPSHLSHRYTHTPRTVTHLIHTCAHTYLYTYTRSLSPQEESSTFFMCPIDKLHLHLSELVPFC